ncbi:MAG: diguanylate cyclase [Wenzhouxiangella sp.]
MRRFIRLFSPHEVYFYAAAGLILTLIVFLLAWSAIDEVRFSSERIGVSIALHEQGLEISGVAAGLPAEQAGLRPGDIVVELGGRPLADFTSYDEVMSARDPGVPVELRVLRDDETVDLSLLPGTTPDIGRLLTQLILVGAYLGLGVLAARYQHQDLRARLLMIFVTLVAIEMALPAGYTLPTWLIQAKHLFWYMATGVQIALELHLVSLIPHRLNILRRRPRLVWLYYAVGLLAGIGLCSLAVFEWRYADGGHPQMQVLAATTVLVGWAIAVAAIIMWQVYRSPGSRERNQALLVLIGLTPWVAYILLSSFWAGWAELDSRWVQHVENVVLLFFPAAIFLAIFRYGLFDVEALVRRSLVYGVIAALVLMSMYILLTATLPLVASRTGDDIGLWVVTALALIIGILFRPIRDGVERLVEKGFFPERRALRQRLIQIAGSLSEQGDMKELVQRLANETRHALHLNWATVVTIDGPERRLHTAFSEGISSDQHAELVRLLNTKSSTFAALSRQKRPQTLKRLSRSKTTSRLGQLGAEVLIPLYFQRRMIGILCLSSKQSGELFLREELELLDLFSHQIATNFENLRLFQDATYERLTGLLRREAVLRQLEIECSRAVAQAAPISVFMIDLDHFKSVNDTHGHLFGDSILKKVAAEMQQSVRAADVLGRYGGEEFLLVLPDTTTDGALRAAEKLRAAVAELSFTALAKETTVQVTVSIGIACFDGGETDVETLAERLTAIADAALYEAKNQGRNRMVIKSVPEITVATEPG